MFDFVHGHKRAVQIVLALIILPFALWGVESYRSGGANYVASVGGDKISVQEFDTALKEQQDRLRAMGRDFDPALIERPEFRYALLENLIRQRLLAREAAGAGLAVPDAQLASVIEQIDAFREDGRFSGQRYENSLSNKGMTPLTFEARVRQELMVEQLVDAYVRSAFVPAAVIDRLVRLNEEQREVSLAQIAPDAYLARTGVDPSEAKAYYDGHPAEFETPEQVRLEYVVLSADAMHADIQVTPGEAKQYFEEHEREFGAPEERRVSHILVRVAASASVAERAAAERKAEDLLKQARQAPFAELAKQHSQDSGSAGNGGDLGYFGRGAMAKSFEDAAFQMKPDEIRGPVQTDFGYHILKLTGIKSGKAASFEEAQDRIEQELRKRKAGKRFAEAAENFSNLVFEQSDGLQPAAEALKLQIRKSPWLSRAGGEGFPGNEKMLAAVFSEDVLKNKRNTEAIEVAPNTLVSARMIEHRPVSIQAFGEVKETIVKQISRNKASELAVQEGKEKLALLAQGKEAALDWGKPVLASRRQVPGDMPEAIFTEVFKAGVTKLPAYVGVKNPQGGYLLARIDKTIEVGEIDDAKRRAYAQQIEPMLGQEALGAFVASLRKQADIKIRQEMLEKKP